MKEKIREGMSFYKIDNKWFSSYIKQTNESTLTILLLLHVHSNKKNFALININYLMSMFGVSSTSRNSINNFKESLQFLLDTGQISVHKNFIDPEQIDFDFNSCSINDTIYIKLTDLDKCFTIVYFNEVESILKYDKLEIRYRRTLLRFFCTLVHRIKNDTNYCYPSIETLTKESGVRSKATCLKYLGILRDELGLIIYDSANLSYTKNGRVHQTPNLYARPEHRKDLIKGVHGQLSVFEKESLKLTKIVNKDIQNHKRKLKQLMNHLDKERLYRELTAEEEERYLILKEEHSSLCTHQKVKAKEEEELLTGNLDEPCDNPFLPYEEEYEEEIVEEPDMLNIGSTKRGKVIGRVSHEDDW